MPTKRRPIVRRPCRVGLSPELVDLLLLGSCDSDPFLEFDFQLDQLRALFEANEAMLRREFAKRRLPGKPWASTLE